MTITDPSIYYALVSSKGAENRVRITRSLRDRPKNRNQLAERLDLDYKTVMGHIEVLEDHGIINCSERQYGAVCTLTWETIEKWDEIDDLIAEHRVIR